MKRLKSEEKKQKDREVEDYEARQNLLGFFSLLLKVDKRVNPHLYKKENNNKN
jgi:hypothetical protein